MTGVISRSTCDVIHQNKTGPPANERKNRDKGESDLPDGTLGVTSEIIIGADDVRDWKDIVGGTGVVILVDFHLTGE